MARVGSDGVVTPAGDGTATVTVTARGRTAAATVKVIDGTRLLDVSFERDVIPVLTRAGCNAGACHGKARGQNGFALSLLGFDADFDYHAIVNEARGRRVPSRRRPRTACCCCKPAARVPHGGGKRLDAAATGLRRAAPLDRRRHAAHAGRRADAGRISVEPAERVLATGGEQQLVVTAHYTDGTAADVTHLATFQSNESAIAAVDARRADQGRAAARRGGDHGPVHGEVRRLQRHHPAAGRRAGRAVRKLPRQNFIDGLVWDKLQRLGITPSEPAGDATFLRRAYLDVIGRLPTPDEARAFLADPSPDKRDRLVDRLLERPEYADYWANKWADLLRPNPYRVGIKAVYNLDAWLRDAFRQNMPYDQFVREIVTAQGSTFRNGPTVVFRDRREPDEITHDGQPAVPRRPAGMRQVPPPPVRGRGARTTSTASPPLRRVGRKGVGLSPPISGGEEIVFTGSKRRGASTRSRGKVLAPRPLVRQGGGARRRRRPARGPRRLDDVADDNPYFAKVIVNRVWADLMGRGLVEPVDDLRATNPPSNGAAARRPGRRLPQAAVRPEEAAPHDHDVARLRHSARCRTSGTSPTRATTRGTTGSGCGRRCCSTPSATSPGAGAFAAAAAGLAGDGSSGRSGRSRCSSTASAGPTRTRTRRASGRATRRSCRRCT